MYILEIFFKRRKFMTIFDDAWKVIGKNISMAQHTENGSDPQLELYYFASVFYCTVYQAAISAGMSTSSAHYLARIQTRKSKVDMPIVSAAEEIFTSPDDEKLAGFGASLPPRLPIWLIYPMAAVLDLVAAILNKSFPVSRVRIHKFLSNSQFSTARLMAAGFEPEFDLKDALNRTIKSEFDV